ncbi:MAG: helix-turn-helix transcriptional regulator [Spirochaetes bacterium]|nr:helix-turn-helix transcriptional regulator [Spirochaetota bacterium]
MEAITGPLHVRRGEKTYCKPTWHWINPVPMFDGYLFWIILDGHGRVKTESAEYEISRGDCLIMRMWEHVEGTHDPAHPLVVPWLHFEYDTAPRLAPPHPREHRRIANITFIAELAERAIARLHERHHDEADVWMRAIMLEIARGDAATAERRDVWAERIDALRLRMHEEPAGIDIGACARDYGCTTDHLIRVFKRATGVTPVDYLVRERVERAKDLLLYSSHSVDEIAGLLGYSDIYYFSRQFKERTGSSPTAFRKPRDRA